ncbi:MAG TPA: S8 family serine peptidase, partial [Gemmatimonadales bacterium]|nr:S8 family serine peptidase [Gemmatimonadales bacterium]
MPSRLSRRPVPALLLALAAACAPASRPVGTVTPAVPTLPPVTKPLARADATYLLPPAVALERHLMPLAPTGVLAWRQAHPDWDGRGVLIAILDSGVDPTVEGLKTTSTGQPKLVDLRDFSGEGRIPLTRVTPQGDAVTVGGRTLTGFGRLMGVNAAGPWYAGTLREIPLGEAPAADVNWNNAVGDTLPVLVTRASDGWVLFADLDGDGSLANERPIHDYLVGHESFGWAPPGRVPALGFVANFAEQGGEPLLDLFFDTSGHGTHVAGIASGFSLYGTAGFDGVAPGAEVMGLKIANDAQGGISTTGSMLAALDYAIRMAAQRQKPLVVNMSFGVGNELEGTARIDRLFDSVLAAHPDVVFTVSAGNDGPGLSTVGFPGTAQRVLSVGATFPRAFLMRDPGAGADPIAYFSSRGGEMARPDLVTPGVAFSSVPRWDQGEEVKGGTSMAAPHAAGLAALLVSGLAAQHRPISALRIRQALMTTAQPLDGLSIIDQGAGLPDVGRAWAWLGRNAAWTPYFVSAIGRDGTPAGTAAFRGDGLAPGDTLQRFVLTPAEGGTSPLTEYSLRSDARWLSLDRRSGRAPLREVTVAYDAAALRAPGLYIGTVTVWSRDTMAGPVARLVNTVVVPAPAGQGVSVAPAPLAAGLERRWSFGAEAGRPFAVEIASASAKDVIRAYLHEPGGQPFRSGNEL